MLTNERGNYFRDITLYFRNVFPIGSLISLWSSGFTFFKVRHQNNCYQILNTVNTCDDKKKRQIVPVLRYYLGKIDVKPK